MIPAQAVEAAHKAIYGEEAVVTRQAWIEDALKAAAPYLIAQAKADTLEDAATAIAGDEDPKDALTVAWLRKRAARLRTP